jgi:hypothetical protein
MTALRKSPASTVPSVRQNIKHLLARIGAAFANNDSTIPFQIVRSYDPVASATAAISPGLGETASAAAHPRRPRSSGFSASAIAQNPGMIKLNRRGIENSDNTITVFNGREAVCDHDYG